MRNFEDEMQKEWEQARKLAKRTMWSAIVSAVSSAIVLICQLVKYWL
jgi:hypothetical protein